MASKRNRPEQQIHQAAVSYLQLMENLDKLMFLHPANGGFRSKVEAGIFKSLGVKAGAPDLIILLPGGRCAFIEIKAPKGYLSAAQKAFRNTVEAFGFAYAECHDLNAVEKFIRKLIAAPPDRGQGSR